MQYRNLGGSGVKVSSLCLGCWMFGYRTGSDDSVSIIRAALDAGINFLDTANRYSLGQSEELVGKAISGRRAEVVLATKVRHRMGPGPNDEGTGRVHIMQEIEASLTRLGTDHIDLYQIHRPDRSVPIDETLRLLDDLRQQGKVRYFGTSNFPAWQICEALWTSDRLGMAPFVSEQPQYSLFVRDAENEVLPLCRKYRLAVLPYSPLAGGWLTGKYRRNLSPPPESRLVHDGDDIGDPLHAAKFDALDVLQNFAAEKGCSLSHLALAWLMAQPGVTAPILGPRTMDQLEDNLGALDLVLGVDDLEYIDGVVPPQMNLWHPRGSPPRA